MTLLAGIDIGGTKCAVSLGRLRGGDKREYDETLASGREQTGSRRGAGSGQGGRNGETLSRSSELAAGGRGTSSGQGGRNGETLSRSSELAAGGRGAGSEQGGRNGETLSRSSELAAGGRGTSSGQGGRNGETFSQGCELAAGGRGAGSGQGGRNADLLEGGERPQLMGKLQIPTPDSPADAIAQLMVMLDQLLETHGVSAPDAIGISCGGPLDSVRGLLLSPPNLPGWDSIDVVRPFRERFDGEVPVALQNDANACALAEWKWGAGRGCSHMVFLTFGTGMGAGMILGGRLHAGANDMAGEIGHMRMAAYGPVGYGKMGSFEGFCSGGGIAQLATTLALEKLQQGIAPAYCPHRESIGSISARTVGEAAYAGDETALEVLRLTADQLGRGLAVLVDLLNPEAIVIGSIYGRLQPLLGPTMLESLRREALPVSLGVCRVLPAALQEQIGDYASLSVALHALEERQAGS